MTVRNDITKWLEKNNVPVVLRPGRPVSVTEDALIDALKAANGDRKAAAVRLQVSTGTVSRLIRFYATVRRGQ